VASSAPRAEDTPRETCGLIPNNDAPLTGPHVCALPRSSLGLRANGSERDVVVVTHREIGVPRRVILRTEAVRAPTGHHLAAATATAAAAGTAEQQQVLRDDLGAVTLVAVAIV